MTTTTEKPMHLIRLEIENFKRIKALTIDAQGRHVLITGANEEGKTSAVDALLWGLDGVAKKSPIHLGSDKTTVDMILGDGDEELHVHRSLTSEGTKQFWVKGKDGGRLNSPKKVVDALLGKYMMDPVSFLERREQDQVDDILAAAQITPPVSHVQKITGYRHDPKPGESAQAYLLRLSADDAGHYYILRKEAKRVMDQKKDAQVEQKAILDALPKMDQPETTGELVTILEALNGQAEERRRLQTFYEQTWKDVDLAKKDVDAAEKEVKTWDFKVRLIEEELAKARKNLSDAVIFKERDELVLAEKKDIAEQAANMAENAPDPSQEIFDIKTKLDAAESLAGQFTKRQAAQENFERVKDEANEAEKIWQDRQRIMQELRDLRLSILKNVDLGITGLEMSDSGLTLKGVPFSEASMAQRIRVACGVALQQNPRLRLLRIDEGERLDQKSLNLLLDLADEKGWKIVMTRVAQGSDAQDLAVHFLEDHPTSNGQLHKPKPEPEETPFD